MLGKCNKIAVEFATYINPKKKFILSSTRVRGNAGGDLWKSSLSMLTNKREHSILRNRNHQELENKYQAQASWKSISLADQTRKTEVERSSEFSSNGSSSRESLLSDYKDGRRKMRHTASPATRRSRDQVTPINSSNSTSLQSRYQTSEKFNLKAQSYKATSVSIEYKDAAARSIKEDLICRKKGTYATSNQKTIVNRTHAYTLEQDKFFEIRETKQQLGKDSTIRKHTPDGENTNQYVQSREHTTEQQTLVQEKTTFKNPFDVKFAGSLSGTLSFDGKSTGVYFDKFFHF